MEGLDRRRRGHEARAGAALIHEQAAALHERAERHYARLAALHETQGDIGMAAVFRERATLERAHAAKERRLARGVRSTTTTVDAGERLSDRSVSEM
jgi:hypothetical protein